MNGAQRSELGEPTGSLFMSRLPGNPTKEDAMWELERMIHQWDDSPLPDAAHGYHRDALWLEEIRHIIQTQERQIKVLDDLLQGEDTESRKTWHSLWDVSTSVRDACRYLANVQGEAWPHEQPERKDYG